LSPASRRTNWVEKVKIATKSNKTSRGSNQHHNQVRIEKLSPAFKWANWEKKVKITSKSPQIWRRSQQQNKDHFGS